MSLIIALAISAAFAAIILLQWRKAELTRRAARARHAILERLIERFRDSEEFVSFARSDEGHLLLGTHDPRIETARSLILMAQTAALLGALGLGFLWTAFVTPDGADINLVRAAEEANYWGTLSLALAAGLAVAFAVAQNRARKWGLLPQ